MSVFRGATSNIDRSPVFSLPDDFTVCAEVLMRGASSPEYESVWPGDCSLPSLGELTRQVLASEKPTWMLEFRHGRRLVALLPVSIETRKVRGIPLRILCLAGYDFYDYLPFSQGDVPDSIWRAGIRRICAHFGADATYLNHLATAPVPSLDKFTQEFGNLCFDQKVGQGWQTLLNIESVKRDVNKAKRLFRYRVENVDGLPAPALFAAIAQLHIERWRYDGIASPFVRPTRRNEYASSEGRMLSTVIFDGDAVIAASLSFVYGNRLLFHTPVINLEYLQASPLKLLLHETIAECARRNFEVFDLGLGDEQYKTRYANVKRPTWNLFLPRTIAGYLAFALVNWRAVPRLRKRLEDWRSRLGSLFLRRPQVLARIDHFGEERLEFQPSASFEWRVFTSFDSYVRFCREVNLAPLRLDHDRLKSGARCLFAVDRGVAIARYWVRKGTRWTDPSSCFELSASDEKLWVFGAQSFTGASVAALLPRLAAVHEGGDVRLVLDGRDRTEFPAGPNTGLAPATDVAILIVEPR